LKRPIKTKQLVANGDVEMLVFEIFGLSMLALFFGAMVNNGHAADR